MQVLSWNVNGIRAAIRKGFFEWLHKAQPDVLCLQETKIHESDIPDDLKNIPGYEVFWHSGVKKGYSGVATLTKTKPIRVQHGLGNNKFDDEGRILLTEFPEFVLLNCYFPNSGRGHDRVQYKLDFNNHILDYCNKLLKQGKQVVVSGDFNVAHKEIDLKNPKTNHKTAGFLPEEREWMSKLLDAGYVDTFRHFNPSKAEYSWWSYRFDARKRNIGWRVDYHVVSEKLLKNVKKTAILGNIEGSDHCPVEIIFT